MQPLSNTKIISEDLTQSKGQHIGDIIGWTQEGKKNRRIIEDALVKFGLSEDVDLPKVTSVSAYRRTIPKAVKGGKLDERKYEAVLLEDNETKIVHAIVRKDIVTGTSGTLSLKDAEFETETKFAFDKEGYKDGLAAEHLFKLEHDTHPISVKAQEIYDSMCVVYTVEDIRAGFQRAFRKWGGCSLLSKGGFWWIPPTKSDKVRDWVAFMQSIGSEIVILPQFETEETMVSLQNSTQSSLEGQLEKLFSQLETFSGKDTTRLSTLEKRVEAFDDLRDKAELYERLLGHNLDEIKTKLEGASVALVQSIKEMTS
jgi:hypothetical protein